jgi:hypothetical protein
MRRRGFVDRSFGRIATSRHRATACGRPNDRNIVSRPCEGRRSTLLANSTPPSRRVSTATLEHGSLAIVRLTWTGVIARSVGSFREGQVLSAHIAQFIDTRDGRIASIETFDCYEPFV